MLNNSQVDNNTASHTSGAGIVNHGTMTLNKSEVNGNTAAGSGVVASGGGIINAQGPPGAAGTGILTLNNSRVNNNRAGGDGGGIANGVPLGGPMPLLGGAGDVESQPGDRQHRRPRRRHLQLRRNGDALGHGCHRQHAGQLRTPGHHRRLHRLTASGRINRRERFGVCRVVPFCRESRGLSLGGDRHRIVAWASVRNDAREGAFHPYAHTVRSGAEVAVFVTRRNGSEVLLVHRSPRQGSYWHVVAGGVEPGETAPEAAERELLEETGLVAEVTAGVKVSEYVYPLTEEPAARRREYDPSVVEVEVTCFQAEAPDELGANA